MLSIPTFAQIEGLQIFRDDADPTRFYYLPRTPTLLTGPDGKPMFTFLRYQFPLRRQGTDPGGGYLVFTAAMREDPGFLETRVKPALQQRVRSELPPSALLPEITLAPVDFTDGEVRLVITDNDGFVREVNLGKPSLFGDNTASVAVELTAEGATLFYEALRRGGSVAAIEYSLRFPVRLPAVTIIGRVDSKEVKQAVMTYTEQQIKDDDFWGGSKTTNVRHRTSIAEVMESQGLVHLEILKGNVNLSDDDMESLRSFAFRAMDEFIKEHFLTGGSLETEKERRSEWMEFLGNNIEKTFDLNVTYRDVINREYYPSAQISPAFLGVPLDSVVHEIDLQNAPWYFNTLEVTVDTNLDFDKYGDIVHSVVGHLTYDERRTDGTRITTRESLRFTADDRAPKTFKTRLADVGRDTYHVEVEVNYKSGPVLKRLFQGFNTMTRHLTLEVPNPGVIEVTFSTDPSAFGSELTAIEVEVEYADPRNDVPRATETVMLKNDTPEVTYRRVIYAPWEQPYRYRFTYILQMADGSQQRSTTAWIEASSATRYVKVPTPFDQQFNLTIVPSVDWREVRAVIVDLEYRDQTNDYFMATSFNFSQESAGIKNWKFPLRTPDHRAYRYRQTLLLHNNAVRKGEWQERESDTQTLVVGNAPHGVATVEVDPIDLDIGGNVRRAIVRLHYKDPQMDLPDEETLVFRDSGVQVWTVVLGPTTRTYTYSIDYFMADGSRKRLENQVGEIRSSSEFLFLPPPEEGDRN